MQTTGQALLNINSQRREVMGKKSVKFSEEAVQRDESKRLPRSKTVKEDLTFESENSSFNFYYNFEQIKKIELYKASRNADSPISDARSRHGLKKTFFSLPSHNVLDASSSNCQLKDLFLKYPVITGTLLVENRSFHKRVFARITLNLWRTYVDIEAHFVSTLADLGKDEFQFDYFVGCDHVGPVQFALCYEELDSNGEVIQQHWDNNCFRNYEVSCGYIESTPWGSSPVQLSPSVFFRPRSYCLLPPSTKSSNS